jgi:hypothetical protein
MGFGLMSELWDPNEDVEFSIVLGSRYGDILAA